MLHVHCGDSSAGTLRNAGVEGAVTVWADVLMSGRLFPDISSEEFLRTRAAHLSQGMQGALSAEALLAHLHQQNEALARYREHDETVLWFDACLYDQTILACLLSWFHGQDVTNRRLSLICLGDHPAVARFCGLGELAGDQLLALLPTRLPLLPEDLQTAAVFWDAMCARTPEPMQAFLDHDASDFAFLTSAAERWLQCYPSCENGLRRLDMEILTVLTALPESTPIQVFAAISKLEERPFFGDTMVWEQLNTLASLATPLVDLDGPGALPTWEPQGLKRWGVRITETGARVLKGAADNVVLNGSDRWLGGVHLNGHHLPWRWSWKDGRIQHCQ